MSLMISRMSQDKLLKGTNKALRLCCQEEAIKARGQGQGFVPNKKRKLIATASGKGRFGEKPIYGNNAKLGRGNTSQGGQAPEEDAGSRPMTKVKVPILDANLGFLLSRRP